MADLARIKRNVSKMVSMGAPEEDIDGYIASEGVTIDDVRNYNIENNNVGLTSDAFGGAVSAVSNPLGNLAKTLGIKNVNDVLGASTALDTGYSAGFGRKASGALNAIGAYPIDRIAEALGVKNTPSFMDRYNEIVQTANQAQAEYEKENPTAATALQVSGAIASPINKIGASAVKNASGVKKIATGAGVGGVTGSIYGAGRAENLEELPQTIIEDVKTGSIVGGAIPAAGQALRASGKLASDLLGITTGTGSRSVEQAYKAGQRGSKTFLENMRGNAGKTDVVDAARNELNKLRIAKNAEYSRNIDAIKTDKTILDLKGVLDKLKGIKNDYNVGGFSKAGKSTQKAIDEVSDIVDDFSKNPNIHTAEGFDALKQRIYDITFPVEEKQANSVIKQMGNAVKNEITKQAPTYAKTMKEYTEASNTIRELENALSLKEGKSVDTALRKLQSAFRNNVASNYGTRGDLVEQLGGDELADAIAGQNLADFMPRGLVGRIAGGAGLYAQNIPAILSSSPRLAGETAYKLGQASNYMPNISVNPAALYLALQNN